MSQEVVLDFGTLANFTSIMKAVGLGDNSIDPTTGLARNVPITSKTFNEGSIFLNVIGTTSTYNASTKTWTTNAGYWVRLRWNADPALTWGGKTLAQISSALTAAGVTIYPLVKFLANGTVDTTYTCPQWARIL